jgi:hypothetical protein
MEGRRQAGMLTEAEQPAVRKDFAVAREWAQAEGRPIFLGEFGASGTNPNFPRASAGPVSSAKPLKKPALPGPMGIPGRLRRRGS